MSFFQKAFFAALFFTCHLNPLVYGQNDLERTTQDFFIDTKQLTIPGYSHAFNPSLVRWKDQWLMSFRVIVSPADVSSIASATESDVGLIFLDEALNPIGTPQFLSLDHPGMMRPKLLAEDARLVVVEETLYLIYSANKEAKIEDAGFRMYVAQLGEDEKGFFVINNEILSCFDAMNPCKREKNWVPFIYENDLLLAYSLSPHKIFRPSLDGSEQCDLVANTYPSLVWEWGELRGGTPALKLNDNYYLGFFHSSILLSTVHSNFQPVPHYFMGAYLFSSTPPFEIKYISPEPIIGKNFYHGLEYEPYWHPVRVVFPCGLVIHDDELWITYGRQDHEIWIAKLDKKKVLSSLIHVSTLCR